MKTRIENCWCERKGRFYSGVTGERRCGYHLNGLPEPIWDSKEVGEISN